MKSWIKAVLFIILAFIVGLLIGYVSILINPNFRVDVSPVIQLLNQNPHITITIIVILLIIIIVATLFAIIRESKKEEMPVKEEKRTRREKSDQK